MIKGWEHKTLESVCIKITDGSHFSPKTTSQGYPYITVRDLQDDLIDFKSCKHITEDDFFTLVKNGCNPLKGDVLFSKDGTVGKVSLVNFEKEFVVLSSLAIIRPNKIELDSAYLKYVMTAPFFLKEAIGKKTGVAIRRIVLRNLKSILIPIPPLSEQKCIVAILDEVLAGISQAVANAEKNLANACELFESYLNNVFTQKGDGWEEKPLGEVCNLIGGGTPSKKNKEFYKGDIYWATVRDMQGDVISKTEFKITKDAVKNSSTNIIKSRNVVIATRVGLGKVCLINQDTAINQDLRGIVPINSEELSVQFLFWWLKSTAHLIEEEGTGATVKGVKLPFVKSLQIPIPTFHVQIQVIEQLDKLREDTLYLETIYQQKLTALNELKQSILQKAFTGELT